MRAVALVLIVAILAGCATVPAGPSVLVLPASDKTFEQFQVDDAGCRHWAQYRTGKNPGATATESTVGGAIVGTLVGAGMGAAMGAALGSPATGAAVGAGSGLIGGAAIGAAAGQEVGAIVQRRYDHTYQQCMYARGHQIGGRAGPPAPAASPELPGPPPPPPGPPPPPPPDAPPPR